MVKVAVRIAYTKSWKRMLVRLEDLPRWEKTMLAQGCKIRYPQGKNRAWEA